MHTQIINPNQLIQAKLTTSSLDFTKYFFKKRFGRSFVVNDHHVQICNALDRVIRGEVTRLCICIAPRYGKTELAVKTFMALGLAVNPSSKFIHLSYSSSLAEDNNEEVRDFVDSPDYRRIFPYVEISKSKASKQKWSTTKGGGSYATATGGQVTGFGAGEVEEELKELTSTEQPHRFAGAIIIDDALKPDDALSDLKRERINQRFENTIRSRTNSRNTPIIIIGQRVHHHDLIGYVLEQEPEQWEVLNIPCISTNEKGEEVALWEFKQTLQELKSIREIDTNVFETQYQQNPVDTVGRLLPLNKLKFWNLNNIPKANVVYRFSCADPADKGGDYYSIPIIFVTIINSEILCFVKDVIYSRDGIEVINDRLIDKTREHYVEDCFFEANGIGAAAFMLFKRDLANLTNVKPFTVHEAKEVRILSNYEFILRHFVFDENYKDNEEYIRFVHHLTSYEREGKNAHKKDAIDSLASAANIIKIKFRSMLYGNG